MAAILDFKMTATRGREYVGGIFFQLPLGGSTPAQSFMLASKTERFWWICGICRSTKGTNFTTALYCHRFGSHDVIDHMTIRVAVGGFL